MSNTNNYSYEGDFSTFDPKNPGIRNSTTSRNPTPTRRKDNTTEIFMQDYSDIDERSGSISERLKRIDKSLALRESVKISSKEREALQFDYNAEHDNYEKQKKKIMLDVKDKVNHFKMSGSSRVRVAEYMNRKNREDPLIYPFGAERDILVLKVLNQVLYDELNKTIRSWCSETSTQSKLKTNQAMLDSMGDAVNKLREEEEEKYKKIIQDLRSDVDLHKRQLKRKNWLISRLFSDKTMFSNYWDEFSMLFVEMFRLLQESEDSEHQELIDRIAKANEFVLWAKDYNDDEKRYINDTDWTAIKEKEKKSFIEDIELSKRKVLDYKRAKDIGRVSFDEPKQGKRLFKTDKKDLKVKDPFSFLRDSKKDILREKTPSSNTVPELVKPKTYQEFANSFNSLSKDQLQDFCLALSEQLTNLKKELATCKQRSESELREHQAELENIQMELQDERDRLAKFEELNDDRLEVNEKEISYLKNCLLGSTLTAFDCLNVLTNLGKNKNYVAPFSAFLSKVAGNIQEQFVKAHSMLNKVNLIHSDRGNR